MVHAHYWATPVSLLFHLYNCPCRSSSLHLVWISFGFSSFSRVDFGTIPSDDDEYLIIFNICEAFQFAHITEPIHLPVQRAH